MQNMEEPPAREQFLGHPVDRIVEEAVEVAQLEQLDVQEFEHFRRVLELRVVHEGGVPLGEEQVVVEVADRGGGDFRDPRLPQAPPPGRFPRPFPATPVRSTRP